MGKRLGDFKQIDINKGYYRCGFKCSMPGCRCMLVGPAENNKGYIINGEACHISTASPGGARYDSLMTNEQRSFYDNLIIMCKTHVWEIDHEIEKYPVELLKNIKVKLKCKQHYKFNHGVLQSL